MNTEKKFSPAEEEKLLSFFFEEIAEPLTPNFSKEDWKELHQRAMAGDLTSTEMYIALMSEKVIPYLDPDFLN